MNSWFSDGITLLANTSTMLGGEGGLVLQVDIFPWLPTPGVESSLLVIVNDVLLFSSPLFVEDKQV